MLKNQAQLNYGRHSYASEPDDLERGAVGL